MIHFHQGMFLINFQNFTKSNQVLVWILYYNNLYADNLNDWLDCVTCVCCISRCILQASRRCLTFSACGQVVHTLFRCAVNLIMAFGVNGVPLPTSKFLTVRQPTNSFLHSTSSIYLYIRYNVFIKVIENTLRVDEKINTTLISVCSIWSYNQETVSLP